MEFAEPIATPRSQPLEILLEPIAAAAEPFAAFELPIAAAPPQKLAEAELLYPTATEGIDPPAVLFEPTATEFAPPAICVATDLAA